jgi:TonB family protein
VHSIPALDRAALAAVRQWKFAATRVDGRPVRVRHVVPVSFLLRVPEVRRQEGIPELRRGMAPAVPRVASSPPAVSVIAELTLASDGSVKAVALREGQQPWADALLSAVRTWRFAPGAPEVTLSFHVEARFLHSGEDSARVTLNLSGLREKTAPAAEPNAPPSSSTSAAVPGPSSTALATNTSSTPPPSPDTASDATPAATPHAADAPSVVQPEGEVINVTQPTPSPEPRPLPPPGTSAVPNVTLEAGVPDLLSGRRPVIPPLARIRSIAGAVVVGFTIDGTGRASVQEVSGPPGLQEQARQAVRSWSFRARLPAERLFLVATFTYESDEASARVRPRD